MTTSAAASSAADRPPFCLCCGNNFEAEQPVTIGPLHVDPHGDAHWNGRKIPLTRAQFLLLGSMAQARGKLVNYDVLAERAGYDGPGDPHNSVKVLVHRARRHLRSVGAPPTIIRATRGRGCSIDVELLLELAGKGPRKC